MSSYLDDATRLLAGLTTGQNTLKTLESLKTVLSAVHPSELKEYVRKIDINRLFTCFSTTSIEQIEITCDLLSCILKCLDPGHALSKYEDLFLEGLSHPVNKVRELILKELEDAAVEPKSAHQLSSSLEIILACVRLVGADDLGVAHRASKVLTLLRLQGDAVNVLFSPPVLKEMQLITSKSDVIRYRIYDIIIQVCSVSDEMLSLCHDTELLQPMLNEAFTGDILIQLNALELLGTLASCSHGRQYLIREEFLAKLINRLDTAAADPFSLFIVPGIVKFLGTVAHFQPEILVSYPGFVKTLFNLLDESDMAAVTIAMQTLSFIANTAKGKTTLNQLGTHMNKALNKIGQMLFHANSDVRLKALEAVSGLIQIPVSSETETILNINEMWFNQLCTKPLNSLMGIVKQPFNDLRLETLDIFLQLSSQPWSQRMMNDLPGFIEFLLDRKAEPNKECLEKKFEIVKTIYESSSTTNIFPQYVLDQIKIHISEGPWFVHAQAAVSLESGS